MNIKDKIEEIRLKACDDFDKRTKFSKNFCIEDYRRSEDYKYWKRRVGSTMHLSRAEECIEHMKTIATHDFDFNTNCLIVKLFEAGLIKDESLDSKKRFEDMSMQELMDIPDSPELKDDIKDKSLNDMGDIIDDYIKDMNSRLMRKMGEGIIKHKKEVEQRVADKFQEFFDDKLFNLQKAIAPSMYDHYPSMYNHYDKDYLFHQFRGFRDSIRDYLKRESEGKND